MMNEPIPFLLLFFLPFFNLFFGFGGEGYLSMLMPQGIQNRFDKQSQVRNKEKITAKWVGMQSSCTTSNGYADSK